MMKNKYYYNIADDMEQFPDAWCILAVGGRGCGKTYSALQLMLDKKAAFVFIKRTIEDVTMLCAGSGRIGTRQTEYGVDLSPFKPINRDRHTDIRAFSIFNGLGGFWECETDEEGQAHPVGRPIGYVVALSAVNKVKGYDMSECDYLIFDEFIPQPWERVNRREGEQLLDLYKTVARDREHRGREPLKLFCLANAVRLSNPVFNTLELTDTAALMSMKGNEHYYNEGILLHMIPDNGEFSEREKTSVIYKALGHTEWGHMAFNNEFAYDDMTQVSKSILKGFTPYCAFTHKRKTYYSYVRDGIFYVTHSPYKAHTIYNLNRHSEQKNFWQLYGYDLREAAIEDRVKFEDYTAYDIIFNYKKVFDIS